MKTDDRVFIGMLPVTKEFHEDMLEKLFYKKNSLISFVNPYSFYLVNSDDNYRSYLDKMDIVLADGIGVVVAAKILGTPVSGRYSFDNTSLAPAVLKIITEKKLKTVFIGGGPGVSDEFIRSLSLRGIDTSLMKAFHGYQSDWKATLKKIHKENPDVIIVGMGAPLQEEILLKLRGIGWKGIGFTCGGFLDQSLQKYDYYPAIVDKLNIRFLYRLLSEPRRLFKRYTYNYSFLLWFVLKTKSKVLIGIRHDKT